MLIINKDLTRHDKDKIRFKTIRYIERYCNIERKCQICGANAEIHHQDYEDYLKINLLCKKHHVALHNFKLVPPQIIDLEKEVIKFPKKKSHKTLVQKNIKEIKKDIIENGKTFHDITKKYKTASVTIKKFLTNSENEELTRKSKENAIKKRKCRNIL